MSQEMILLTEIDKRLRFIEETIEHSEKRLTNIEMMIEKADKTIATIAGEVKPTLDALMENPMLKMFLKKGDKK